MLKLICLQDELTEIPQIDDEINEMENHKYQSRFLLSELLFS